MHLTCSRDLAGCSNCYCGDLICTYRSSGNPALPREERTPTRIPTIEPQAVKGPRINGRPSNGQPPNGRLIEGPPIDGPLVNGPLINGPPINGQPLNEHGNSEDEVKGSDLPDQPSFLGVDLFLELEKESPPAEWPTRTPEDGPRAAEGQQLGGQSLYRHGNSEDEVEDFDCPENYLSPGIILRQKPVMPPPPAEWPDRSHPDTRGWLGKHDGVHVAGHNFPAPYEGKVHHDECGEDWEAQWKEDLGWWFWMKKDKAAPRSAKQIRDDLERHRQTVKDLLGPIC